jgi:hypothetical protein
MARSRPKNIPPAHTSWGISSARQHTAADFEKAFDMLRRSTFLSISAFAAAYKRVSLSLQRPLSAWSLPWSSWADPHWRKLLAPSQRRTLEVLGRDDDLFLGLCPCCCGDRLVETMLGQSWLMVKCDDCCVVYNLMFEYGVLKDCWRATKEYYNR